MATRTKISKVIPISLLVIVGITLFVIFLLIAVALTQSNFSHKVTSITFTTESGPVSPEFQQSQILSITPNSCQYTVNKISPVATTSTPCSINSDNFIKIVNSYNTYDVANKMLAQEGKTTQTLLGGKKRSISIQLQDGTVVTANADEAFIEGIEPFIEDVELYVPQIGQLGFTTSQ